MLDRIKELIETLGVSNTVFAKQIGVSSATLSHITSGRNKPSLDLVMAILNAHPSINSEWLLFGRGKMQKQKHKDIIESNQNEVVHVEYRDQPKPVDHITVFYDDNTYCTFYPK